MDINDIKKDLKSFADDEDDVIIDNSGDVIFSRMNDILQFRIILDNDTNTYYVDYNGIKIPYVKFLIKNIAKLDIFANKILDTRPSLPNFIDSHATLLTPYNHRRGKALALLNKECRNSLPFSTKIIFITADAGHGKTVLLKEFQNNQALDYIKGESSFIVWHIDLQGRELVRLNEALAYDLGEMRLSLGLYHTSILTLLKHNKLILAIDGFDELAAEVGGTKALGSLANLVGQLEGKGTIIAASRRAFFNTQDYAKKNDFLRGQIKSACEIFELQMDNWNKDVNIEYISKFFESKNALSIFDGLVQELHDDKHPILTRPYLFTKIINLSHELKDKPSTIISGLSNKREGLNIIVEAFIRREVTKWQDRDHKTGQPYLSFDQHIQLLSFVASELWRNQQDSISVEYIHFILALLYDEWDISEELKPLINRMAESHAFLIPDPARPKHRIFEHVEFKYFFLAKELKQLIEKAFEGDSIALKKFLYISQLPDSVALFVANDISDKSKILPVLLEIISNEWKSTYLQSNVGTLIPFLLDDSKHNKIIKIDQKINFNSIIFENKSLNNLHFKGSNFINISFRNTQLENIIFENCIFNEIRIYTDSGNIFKTIELINCEIDCTVFIDKNDERYPEFSPNNIKRNLKTVNFTVTDNFNVETVIEINEDYKKMIKKFISKFNSSTYQLEKNIKNEPLFARERDFILEKAIPLLEKHSIIEEKETKNSKQASSRAWRLIEQDISKIFIAEEDMNSGYFNFWKDVSKLK